MVKIFSILVFSISSYFDQQACLADFEVHKSYPSANGNFELDLKLKSGVSGEYNLELYDLVTGDVVMTKKAYFNVGERKTIFKEIKASTYNVIFSTSQCSRKAIKGKGIVLE